MSRMSAPTGRRITATVCALVSLRRYYPVQVPRIPPKGGLSWQTRFVQHSDKLSAASINSFFSDGKRELLGALLRTCGFYLLICSEIRRYAAKMLIFVCILEQVVFVCSGLCAAPMEWWFAVKWAPFFKGQSVLVVNPSDHWLYKIFHVQQASTLRVVAKR